MMTNRHGLAAAILLACVGAPVSAQSLFQQVSPVVAGANADPAAPVHDVSLISIRPPEPRTFAPNDLVTIIVSESSSMRRDQKVSTEKDFSIDTARVDWGDLLKFIALAKGPGSIGELASPVQIGHSNEFEGEGNYERRDTIQNRVTARVLEVKPNGTLLLEARTHIQTDEEIQTYVLSGICRSEDVTDRNTVQSGQIFDLRLIAHHEGPMRDANKKGIFTRVLETLFNF